MAIESTIAFVQYAVKILTAVDRALTSPVPDLKAQEPADILGRNGILYLLNRKRNVVHGINPFSDNFILNYISRMIFHRLAFAG